MVAKFLNTTFSHNAELSVSWEHQSFKDERENITQNVLFKKQQAFFSWWRTVSTLPAVNIYL